MGARVIPLFTIGLLSLSLLIIIHELGHLLAAKRAGIKVVRFAVFFPPIWSFNHAGTNYALGLLPFGGYCQMQGSVQTIDQPKVGDYFFASLGWRSIVNLAGPLTNLLFAWLILSLFNFFYPQPDVNYSAKVAVLEEIAGAASPAAQADIRDGDFIRAVDGVAVDDYRSLQQLLARHESEQDILIDYRRGDQLLTTVVKPVATDDCGRVIGVFPWERMVFAPGINGLPATGFRSGERLVTINQQQVVNFAQLQQLLELANRDRQQLAVLEDAGQHRRQLVLSPTDILYLQQEQSFQQLQSTSRPPLWSLLVRAATAVVQLTASVANSILAVFSGSISLSKAIMGPVQLSLAVGEQGSAYGFRGWLFLMAVLSINLAVVNLLPIPGLDGGNIVFSLIAAFLPRSWQGRTRRCYLSLSTLFLIGILLMIVIVDARSYLVG